MKKTMIAALGLAAVAGVTMAADGFHDYEARLRSPVISALGNDAQFRSQHLVAGFLCGEASPRGAPLERFIAYSGGYAVEGHSLISFYPAGQESGYVTSSLRLQASMGEKVGRHISTAELYAAEFNDLWHTHCE